MFCGAGGISTAVLQAARRLGVEVQLTAVNHWDTAVNSHSLNHPGVFHILEPVENLWPRRVIPAGYLDVLCASCECTFHSIARGGGACNEQSRAQPWQIQRWATDLEIPNILMENVSEWQDWGPLHPCTCGASARAAHLSKHPVIHKSGNKCLLPIPGRKGEYFRAFITSLQGLGYTVEIRHQICDHYGDATSRKRLMLMARKYGAITWPTRTHFDPETLASLRGGTVPPAGGVTRPAGHGSPTGTPPGLKPKNPKLWRVADDIIDYEQPSTSIFEKWPCDNTVERIIAGFRKQGGPCAEAFIAILRGSSRSHLNNSQSVDEPLPTITASGKHHWLIEPFLLPKEGYYKGNAARSTKGPLPALTRKPDIALVESFLMHLTHQGGHHRRVHTTRKPLPTVTGAKRGEIALIEPMILGQQSCAAARRVQTPVPTVAGRGAISLVEPILVQIDQTGGNGAYAYSIKKPLKTVVTKQNMMLVEPFILPTKYNERKGQQPRTHSTRRPLPTVVTSANHALVEPFLVKYYRTGAARSLRIPLDTVTTKDRFMLIEPKTRIVRRYDKKSHTWLVIGQLDIRKRMLKPHELAAAHSFPKHYQFTGTQEDQTTQIGNSVPVEMGKAHVRTLFISHLEHLNTKRKGKSVAAVCDRRP